MVDALSLSINKPRFRENFEELSRIGATSEGGVNRPAFSDAHTEARAWFRERALEAELEFKIDGAANHSAFLHQAGAEKTILLGSHLDSVPNGGRFDGALGVVAALEVLLTVKDAEIQLPVHMEAIDFSDEEFTYVEYLGSRAFTGQLEADNLRSRSESEEEFERIIVSEGLSMSSMLTCGRDPRNYSGYLELHIEQGSRLEDQGYQLGLVTSIVAIWSYQIVFRGRADHAGTTPMTSRQDAGLGAAAFTLAFHKMMIDQFPDCVANVGNMAYLPGVSNVVPDRVDVALEFRAPDDIRAEKLGETIAFIAREEAQRYDLEVEIQKTGHSNATPMHSNLQEIISIAAKAMDLRTMRMASGAGHDAQILAHFTSTGMILVPSVAGISHNPKEFTKWEDCVNGANALLGSAIRWAHQAQ
jgi:N-carbamoyl-L-amino-acid hydrolase